VTQVAFDQWQLTAPFEGRNPVVEAGQDVELCLDWRIVGRKDREHVRVTRHVEIRIEKIEAGFEIVV